MPRSRTDRTKTPILRADALDDDLQVEEDEDVPEFATGGIVHKPEDGSDSIPFVLRGA